jgi:hypothetical protein
MQSSQLRLDSDGDLISTDGSLSTEDLDDDRGDVQLQDLLERSEDVQSRRNHRLLRPSEVDFEEYRSKRKMSQMQERWNAITMIPSPLYCVYYILSGVWVHSAPSGASDRLPDGDFLRSSSNNSGDVVSHCLPLSRWHSMPALPPLPVLAVAIAIILHAPFSIIYHWRYATTYDIAHWSRRLDQSFIHVASALVSYATSGSWDYFCANVLYNVECIYRLHLPRVRPRANQMRITISILAYVFPILRRGDIVLFLQLSIVLGVGGWLFSSYPIGGWSHAAFHIVMCLLPPLIMEAASELPVSQSQMEIASTCAETLFHARQG